MPTSDETRYVLEYIPKTGVQKLHDKHLAEIKGGASIWDICPPEYLAKERLASTEAGALAHAKILVALDEFGEVHVFEQQLQQVFGHRKTWENTRRAVVYAEDESFSWETI